MGDRQDEGPGQMTPTASRFNLFRGGQHHGSGQQVKKAIKPEVGPAVHRGMTLEETRVATREAREATRIAALAALEARREPSFPEATNPPGRQRRPLSGLPGAGKGDAGDEEVGEVEEVDSGIAALEEGSKVAVDGHFDQNTTEVNTGEEVVSKSDTGDAFDQAPLDTTPDTTKVNTGEEVFSKVVAGDRFDQDTPRETGEEVDSKMADLGRFDQAPLDTKDTTRETEAARKTGETTIEAAIRCKHCGQEFVPKAAMRPVGYRRGRQQVYCSPGCRAKAANEGRKEKRRKAAREATSEASREAPSEASRETATCKHCGQEFVRVRRRGRLQVYCSPGCTKTGQASEAKKKARKAGL